jgi:NDP-sugar pyrophosphorylase family protein
MKAILICPAERSEVAALAETAPLANLCILGKPFVHHWLEYFSSRGVTEIKILAADRPNQIRELIGDGARWGFRVEIIPESHELSCDEAQKKYFPFSQNDPPEVPVHIALIDHLPNFPEQKLFENYAGFFSAIQFWLSQNPTQNQIGVREIKPGIWTGLRTQISPNAKLFAPCWIGENVLVKSDAVIGPAAILENGVVVENAATIYESWIGTQTFAGNLVQIKDSLALGSTLVNFRINSVAKIPDEFLLCSLRHGKYTIHSGNFIGRLAALFALAITFPFALITFLKTKWQGSRAVRPRRATAPQTVFENSSGTVTYFEFANANGWWRRWPQLWNIARGEFAWIGNRPLTPFEAGKLQNDFERLWLAAPIGLISQGDAEGCTDISSDEARAHASFYSAQANWRLDCAIFFRALIRLLLRKPPVTSQNELPDIKSHTVELIRP